jgi:hypothetical protein
MSHTLDESIAIVGAAHLAQYMRCAKLQGVAEVYDDANGYCLGVTLAEISPETLDLVPRNIDGLTVKVLV